MFDVNKSNDPKEGKFVLDTFNKLLNDINWQKRLSLDQKQWVNMRKAFLYLAGDFKNIEPDYCIFSTSFSKLNPIQEIVPWQVYGDNGKGVAIGFKTKELKENTYLEEINYITQEEMDEKVEKFIHTYKNSNEDSLIEEMRKFYLNSFVWKRKCFEHEQEVRILAKELDLCDDLLCLKSIDDDIDFFMTNNTIKLCQNIDIRKNGYDVISSVVLGPSCSVTEKEMLIFLKKYLKRFVSLSKASDLIR